MPQYQRHDPAAPRNADHDLLLPEGEAADDDVASCRKLISAIPDPGPKAGKPLFMMLADSVEAASRTRDACSGPDPGMIDRLAGAIIDDKQFDDCDITFRDVELIKESFQDSGRHLSPSNRLSGI